jgi:hypothetical protein
MVRFVGRSYQTTTIPSKPIPTGFKIWTIAQMGYFLQWIWHERGNKNGPVGVITPCELGGTKAGKGGNKTQATVVHLLKLLPPAHYHVFLDNLFTSKKLLHYLRDCGWAATGTCRVDSGVVSELVEVKKAEKRKDSLPWGTLLEAPTESNKVNQMGWKDNSFVLFQSTVYHGNTTITRSRKRPKLTSSSAKTARAVFGDKPRKDLEIPVFADDYNHIMNGCDRGNQLKSYNPGLRPIRCGGWQSLFHWLLNTVLVNSYLLSFHSDVSKELKFQDQVKFRNALIDALFKAGKAGPAQRKRANIGTNYDGFTTPAHRHSKEHRGVRGDCRNCKGERHGETPRKRVVLGQISPNLSEKRPRKTSVYGCRECNIPLCKEGLCFDQYHSNN